MKLAHRTMTSLTEFFFFEKENIHAILRVTDHSNLLAKYTILDRKRINSFGFDLEKLMIRLP